MDLKSLGPAISGDIDIYSEAIDFALKETNINNIAITGNYGSGKSSVIKSYLNKRDYNSIEISMLNYNTEKNNEGKSENKSLFRNITGKEIEYHIINQITHQINPSKIPLTAFNIKTKISNIVLILLSISVVVLFICTYIINIFLKDLESSNVKAVFNNEIFSTALLVWIISALYLVYGILKALSARKGVKRIKMMGMELEAKEGNLDSESLFNMYIDEILYIFEKSKTDVVIFEDIDRFDDPALFIKLRDMNVLINKKIFVNKNIFRKRWDEITGGSHQIKFLYLIKDSLFKADDRSKLFDLTIPIIPVMGIENSYDFMLKEKEEKPKYYDQIDNGKLYGISLYISDMRTLKSIFNEYQIYFKLLSKEKMKINQNELFALMVYKNMEPLDFSYTQNRDDRSYVLKVANEIQEMKKIEIEEIEAENGKGVIVENYESMNISEFLKHENLSCNDLDVKTDMTNKSLVQYIINSGLINYETIGDYIDSFYESSITLKDKNYIRSLKDRELLPIDTKIDSPTIVISRLELSDYYQRTILNHDLIEGLFENDNVYGKQKSAFMNNPYLKDGEFLIEYFKERRNVQNLINTICLENPNLLVENLWNIGDEENKVVLKLLLGYKISHSIISNEMLEYLSKNIQILESEYENDYNVVFSKIGKTEEIKVREIENKNEKHKMSLTEIKSLNIKFEKIDDTPLSDINVDFIEKHSLYKITNDNLLFIVRFFSNGDSGKTIQLKKMLTHIEDLKEHSIFGYVWDNIEVVLENLLAEEINTYDDEKILIKILENSILERSVKENYVKFNKTKVTDLRNMNREFWLDFVECDVVSKNFINLFSLYELANYSFSQKTLKFLNNNLLESKFSKSDMSEFEKDDQRRLFSSILVDNSGINDAVFNDIVKNLGWIDNSFSITEITNEKLMILIKNKILTGTESNINFLLNNFPNHFIELTLLYKENYFELRRTKKDVTTIEIDLIIKSEEYSLSEIEELIKLNMEEMACSPSYADSTNKAIIENKYSKKLILSLVEEYETYSTEFQEYIFSLSAKNITDIIGEWTPSKNIGIEVIRRIKKFRFQVLIFNKISSELTNSEFIEVITKDLNNPELINILGTKHIKLKSNEQNNFLLKSIEARGFLSSTQISNFKEGYNYTSYGRPSKWSRAKVKKYV